MMHELKPYPVYKNSDVSWLGNMPDHWQIVPHRTVFAEINKRDQSGEQMLSVTISKGVIRQTDLLSDSSKKDSSNEDRSKYKLACPDDLVYNKMRAWQGSIGVSDWQGIVSPAYIVMRFRKQQVPRYFHYLYRTPMFAKEAERWSYGITSDMWSLRPEHFKMIYTCLPPPAEQTAIVRYLEYMDRDIRKYIRVKQKLIKLLEEQKQAIIHQAVTRGLDRDVPMKPSGVEWLGDMPGHWKILNLGIALKKIEQGWSPNAAEGELDPEQWAVLTLSSVKKGKFIPSAIKPISMDAKIPERYRIEEGDLLLTRSNTRELVGDVCIVRNPRNRTIISDLIYRLTVNRKLMLNSFLMYQLLDKVGRFQIERDARGSSGTMPKVSQKHIKSWRVIIPPEDEQREIVSYIDTETASITNLVNRMRNEISLIKEYRTRLIADVVTGKVDVREIAATLPEIEESDTNTQSVLRDVNNDVDDTELTKEDADAAK
ncbi:restriction endonuclease subunit S [bacterium]|nr:restriction endonuclease subunit S [bacterium]